QPDGRVVVVRWNGVAGHVALYGDLVGGRAAAARGRDREPGRRVARARHGVTAGRGTGRRVQISRDGAGAAERTDQVPVAAHGDVASERAAAVNRFADRRVAW